MRLSFCCTLILLSGIGTALAQDTNFATGPQYLMNYGSPMFAHPISTPSLSLSGTLLEVGASNATAGLAAGADTQTAAPTSRPAADLFPIYYGPPPASVIEISFAESQAPPNPLPASILDTGVWQVTTVQALRERGYGITLAEAAALGKERARHANHIYTNDDITRLHGGS
jgi:hypothetical protein